MAIKKEEIIDEVIEVESNGKVCYVKVKDIVWDPVYALEEPTRLSKVVTISPKLSDNISTNLNEDGLNPSCPANDVGVGGEICNDIDSCVIDRKSVV